MPLVIDRARLDRSTAWVAVASVVAGVLDALATILCLWLGVTTGELGAATLAVALFPIIDRLGGINLISAAVRQPETDPAALSTICWLGVIAASVVTAALALARPLIGGWFPDPIVATLLVAYSGRLVVRHFSVVPEAMLKRELRYRELSRVQMLGSLAEITGKLGCAYLAGRWGRELAIWGFVVGPIANGLVTTVATLAYYPWRPRLTLRRAVAVDTIRFTAALSGGELLYFAYTSADYLVIGAWFGNAAVGVYRLAYELVLDVVRLLSLVTTEVAFPTFARLARDRDEVAAHLLRFTRQNLVVLAPFLIVVGVEADDLLRLLFGALPPEAATMARILCIVGALRTVSFILPAMLAGLGLATRVLAYHSLAAVVLPAAFVLAVMLAPGQGAVAVAWAWALGYPIAFVTLLALALPAAGLTLATYLRALVGVTLAAAGALVVAVLARGALPATAVVRVATVAPVVLAVYALLLGPLAGVRLGAMVRGLRAREPDRT